MLRNSAQLISVPLVSRFILVCLAFYTLVAYTINSSVIYCKLYAGLPEDPLCT